MGAVASIGTTNHTKQAPKIEVISQNPPHAQRDTFDP
jgi:hypothetical protein